MEKTLYLIKGKSWREYSDKTNSFYLCSLQVQHLKMAILGPSAEQGWSAHSSAAYVGLLYCTGRSPTWGFHCTDCRRLLDDWLRLKKCFRWLKCGGLIHIFWFQVCHKRLYWTSHLRNAYCLERWFLVWT